MVEDLRLGFRHLRRTPGFWVVCVLILALGVGANATMYTTIRGLIFAPLEAVLSDRAVVLTASNPGQGRSQTPLSLPDLLDLGERTATLEKLSGYQWTTVTLTGVKEAERMHGAQVSACFFELTGASMSLGRPFTVDESRPGRSQVIVLTDGLWKRKFAADPGIIGRTIQLDGVSYTVIGVAAPRVWFPSTETQFYTPLVPDPGAPRARRTVRAFAQLKPGIFLGQANQEAASIAGQLSAQFPDTNAGWQIQASTPYEGMITENDRLAVKLIFLVTAGVLLIACANLANLLLARAVSRTREMAVRLALGADRWRLIRLSLAETLWIAIPAAGVAVLVSYWAGDLLLHSFNSTMSPPDRLVDLRVVMFAMLVALASTLLFGLTPALRVLKPQLAAALVEGGTRAGTGRWSRRLAGVFVVVQVALALAALGFGGLLLRTVANLHRMNPGFQTANMAMVVARAELWKHRTPAQYRAYFEELVRQVAAAPGVEAAAAFSVVPQVQGDGALTTLVLDGQPVTAAGERPSATYIAVTAGALETLRVRVLAGRGITVSDTESSPRVAVINQTMARRYWPAGDPIGKRFRAEMLGQDWITVAGVFADVKPAVLVRPSSPQFFIAYARQPVPEATVVARTKGDVEAVLPDIQRVVRTFDPEQPALFTSIDIENYRDLRGGRTLVGIQTAFGLLALALSGVGLFALLSYSVRQRMGEIGIRVALGAGRADVLALVFGYGFRLVAAGFGFGLVVGLLMAKAASSLLYEVSAADPLTYGVSAAMLAVVALLACLLPARAAARADPAAVLRVL